MPDTPVELVPIDKLKLYPGNYRQGDIGAITQSIQTNGWLRQCLVWLKHRMTPGRSDYHYRHEMILYGWKPGAAHQWAGGRTQTSVLEFDRPHASPERPTMKPVNLIAYCIRNSTTEGDSVVDPFCGSGSTLLAAAQTGRSGAGIELEPKYVAVTLDRLAAIGLEPKRVDIA